MTVTTQHDMQTLHATVEHHRFSPVEHSRPSGHIQSGTKESIPEGECVKIYGKMTDETQIDISFVAQHSEMSMRIHVALTELYPLISTTMTTMVQFQGISKKCR
jgi:hypothetical protein